MPKKITEVEAQRKIAASHGNGTIVLEDYAGTVMAH